ncbi:MAG: lipopolysaccharide export system permease protein [Kiritimatiellia bacterium]
MRVLNRYLLFDFLMIFGLTLLVFTFVLYMAGMIKAIDLMSQGIAAKVILQIFAYQIPYILSFTVPMSTLTASLLLFGRLSIDGEITALRACGMSLPQIVSPVLLAAVVLTMICVWINWEVSPNSHWARRKAMVDINKIEPIDLLEEGRYVTGFPGLEIFVKQKKGGDLKDVHVREIKEGVRIRSIRAQEGDVKVDKEALVMTINLKRVMITQYDPDDPYDLSKARTFPSEYFNKEFPYGEMLANKNITKKFKDKTFTELMDTIKHTAKYYPVLIEEGRLADLSRKRMQAMVEASKRIAFSIACFSFALLGIPLGMRSKRKESSAGIGVSLILVFTFYLFVIIADSLTAYPNLLPDLIVWIPIIVSQVAGFWMLKRIA